MKKFWITGLAIALLLLLAGVAGNWRFRPPPPDELLRQTPRQEAARTLPAAAEPFSIDVEELLRRNVLDPGRGAARRESAAPALRGNRPEFELIGISRFGDQAGAIIDSKLPHSGDSGKKRNYHALGGEVGGGFVLAEIKADGVILKMQNETLDLRLGRKRSGEKSAKNRAALHPVETAAPDARRLNPQRPNVPPREEHRPTRVHLPNTPNNPIRESP